MRYVENNAEKENRKKISSKVPYNDIHIISTLPNRSVVTFIYFDGKYPPTCFFSSPK